MVLILDGNSKHVARVYRSFRRKKNLICECSRSYPMHLTGQITEIAPYVRTYFWLPSGMSTMPITEDFRFKYRIAFIHPAIKTGFLTVILRGLDIDSFTIIYISGMV